MKVGFCSTDGVTVNEHFGRTEKIFVYDVRLASAELIEERIVKKAQPTRDLLDAIDEKIERIKDCKIVYFTEIGGPAAAKLIKNNMFPVKTDATLSINETINMLQKSFENPPVWIKKILREENEIC